MKKLWVKNAYKNGLRLYYEILNTEKKVYLNLISQNIFNLNLQEIKLDNIFRKVILNHQQFQKALSHFTRDKKILSIIAFGSCNFIKIWDFVLFALYTNNKNYQELITRNISGEGYIKFKSYASKFEGSLPVSVFQHDTHQVDKKNILYIKQQPFYQAVMWRTSVEEAINKIPQFFIYILALSSDSNEITFLWFVSFLQQLKEGIFAVRDILEVVVKDYFIPALILSMVSVDQFFQSMLYLSSISNQMLLEYPKSFQILSKVKEEYLKDKFTLKINLMNINFSNYEEQKKEKILAQFRYVLASTQNILEIDQTQKLFYMGSEIEDFINCLKVSPIYQLKLNFNLIEVNPKYILHINSLVQLCPMNLQFLQISVETFEEIQLKLNVNRLTSLKSISYAYYQVMYQDQEFQRVLPIREICINETFLQLDKYNFEQLYFEIAGNLKLTNCQQFFRRFTKLKFLKMSLNNKNNSDQSFVFSENLNEISNLETLDVSFENIQLQFQNFPFNRLRTLRLILKNCQFQKQELQNILKNLNYENTKSVQMEIIDSKEKKFTQQEIRSIVKNLEDKKIDVSIKIDTK